MLFPYAVRFKYYWRKGEIEVNTDNNIDEKVLINRRCSKNKELWYTLMHKIRIRSTNWASKTLSSIINHDFFY